MGMYDRDWYREERRQARQGKQQQPINQLAPKPVSKPPIKPAKASSGGSSAVLLLFVLAVGFLLGYWWASH